SGHRRCQPVRCGRLHRRQLHRRRALRRHRSEDPGHVSTVAVRMRARRRTGKLRPAWRQPLAVAGIVIAVAWVVLAIFAPLIAPYDPLAQTFAPSQGPSGAHLFGTDELGRDVLSRVIFGSRVSIPIALLLVTLAALIGGLIGGLAGYFRGL